MDPNANPFNPGVGTPPPELVGRDPVLQQADVTLERIKRGRSERSLLFVGLRGVGKTVLLREVRRRALDKGYAVEMMESQEDQTLAELLVPALRRLLLELDAAKRTFAEFIDAVEPSKRAWALQLQEAAQQGYESALVPYKGPGE